MTGPVRRLTSAASPALSGTTLDGVSTMISGLTAVRAGLLDYQAAWDEQRRLHESVVAGEQGDTVLLLEHPSVYTAGKRTEPWDRPTDGTPVVDVDRGGKITWHGPGQLVGYPIVRLPDPVDVVAYVRRTEQMLIDVCAEFGLTAGRIEGRSGVWVPEDDRGPARKVAAIGIRVARGVTLHGFAINCDCDLGFYDRIVPCGIRDAGVTSLTAELGRPVTVTDVLPVVERRLSTLVAVTE
ncbi:lipoyl(octanoyl) transferase [Micromonospora krabiensis]|uniref:Octanoyltransferase n=2 Tax=Micromonospora krabiensis TaxID=307121 RepID=A0A1C3NCT3_9ACTN|nr:lipoyl(octanoyl) transferase [Micromonospora krabiensis]